MPERQSTAGIAQSSIFDFRPGNGRVEAPEGAGRRFRSEIKDQTSAGIEQGSARFRGHAQGFNEGSDKLRAAHLGGAGLREADEDVRVLDSPPDA